MNVARLLANTFRGLRVPRGHRGIAVTDGKEPQRPPSVAKWLGVPPTSYDPDKYDLVLYKTGDGISLWRKMLGRGYLVPKVKAPDRDD